MHNGVPGWWRVRTWRLKDPSKRPGGGGPGLHHGGGEGGVPGAVKWEIQKFDANIGQMRWRGSIRQVRLDRVCERAKVYDAKCFGGGKSKNAHLRGAR